MHPRRSCFGASRAGMRVMRLARGERSARKESRECWNLFGWTFSSAHPRVKRGYNLNQVRRCKLQLLDASPQVHELFPLRFRQTLEFQGEPIQRTFCLGQRKSNVTKRRFRLSHRPSLPGSYFLPQRVDAAFAAIWPRRSGVSFAALAAPPAAARVANARFGIFSPVTRSRMERAEESDSSTISSGDCSRGGLLTGSSLASGDVRPCPALLQPAVQTDP